MRGYDGWPEGIESGFFAANTPAYESKSATIRCLFGIFAYGNLIAPRVETEGSKS